MGLWHVDLQIQIGALDPSERTALRMLRDSIAESPGDTLIRVRGRFGPFGLIRPSFRVPQAVLLPALDVLLSSDGPSPGLLAQPGAGPLPEVVNVYGSGGPEVELEAE